MILFHLLTLIAPETFLQLRFICFALLYIGLHIIFNNNRNFLVMIYIIKPFSAAILSLFVLYIVFAIEFL